MSGRTEESVQENELRCRTIFEQSMDPILVVSDQGKLLDFNAAAHEALGYAREEFARLDVAAIEANETPAETRAHMEKILITGSDSFTTKHRTRSGEIRDVVATSRALTHNGARYFITTLRDVTEQKRIVAELERKSIALQELFSQVQQQNRKFGARVSANVETIIMPMVHDLKRSLPPPHQSRLAALAEAIEELTAPFASALSGVGRLTPVESRICRLLRGGMSTKEIAEVQHVAPATVSKHRENIRRKLGIANTETNLVTHLNNLLLDEDNQ